MAAWKKMHIDDLHEIFKNRLPEGHLILDVRDEDEFAEGHIEGAVNVPHERVTEAADQLRRFKQVYVHCGGGGRAG
ncbi:MAG: rhodanese-like domain-containing protein, partial [Bdellovibrionota bacterium]